MRSKEFAQPKKSLVIFDIDDTLLHTTAKIKVVKNGVHVRELTNQELISVSSVMLKNSTEKANLSGP